MSTATASTCTAARPACAAADRTLGSPEHGPEAASRFAADSKVIHLDAWHDIRTPGGYEWWYFDAEFPMDDGGPPMTVVAIVYCGFPFTPAYYSAAAAKATPAQAAADPYRLSRQPLDHTAVSLSVTRGADVLATGVHEFAARHFAASKDEPRVTIGDAVSMMQEPSGDYVLSIRVQTIALGRQLRSPGWNQHTNLSMRFSPLCHSAVDQPWSLHGRADAEHTWYCGAPRCRVTADLSLEPNGQGSAVSKPLHVRLDGLGYHDHNAGNRPLTQDIRRWQWARLVSRELGIVMYDSEDLDGRRSSWLSWMHDHHAPQWACEDHVRMSVERWRLSPLLMWYPARTRIVGEHVDLTLHTEGVHELAPFYKRYAVRFTGQINSPNNRLEVNDVGIGEFLQPNRLAWPLVQAMLRTRMQYHD